jgi:tRNA(His) guanylyltransferase
MEQQNLSDWCKWLEKNFSPEIMIPTLPVIIRLDGSNFHSWARGLDKPFDPKLTELMIQTTAHLVKETSAVVGYTQSDEITLILYSSQRRSEIYHCGKKQKIVSKLTGSCVNFFNQQRLVLLPNHNKIANFDCRIYQTPTLLDACNQLLWREHDATKNSISMLAQSQFSHKSLQHLTANQLQEKLRVEKQINWNNLPACYKRGTYISKVTTSKPFTGLELASLPPQHHAHTNPDLVITRTAYQRTEYPIFQSIKNKVDVIFNGADVVIGDPNQN